MAILSKFDKLLVVFFVVVLGIIFVAAGNVDTGRPYHQFHQVAVGIEKVVNDSNQLLPKYGGTGIASCTDGNILKWDGNNTNGHWSCGSVSFTAGGLPTCTNGQILKYSIGTWGCGDDNSGIMVPLETCEDKDVLKWDGANKNWFCAKDNDSAANKPLPVCSDGNILKWSGSPTSGGWVCGTDLNGAASSVNNYYSLLLSDNTTPNVKQAYYFPSGEGYISANPIDWNVPLGVTKIRVSVWGGGGGGAYHGGGGAAGAFEEGTYNVAPGQRIKIYVGNYGGAGYFSSSDCSLDMAKGHRYGSNGMYSKIEFVGGALDGTSLQKDGGAGGVPTCATSFSTTPGIGATNGAGVSAGFGGEGGKPTVGSPGTAGRVVIYQSQ